MAIIIPLIRPICKCSVRPSNALDPQELLDARRAVEAPPSALLGATVREVGLVVDGAIVDVYSAIFVNSHSY